VRVSTAPTGDVADHVLDLDAAHWARQGSVSFDCLLDGDVIVGADLVAGFMHRGAEKLFEVRDYRQGLALSNRHDWLAPVGGEILMARAVEELLGMPVPAGGRRMRVLLLELTRVGALLAFLGPAAPALALPDSASLRRDCAAAREQVLTLLEQISGARMHVTYTVVGGVRAAAPDGWCEDVAAAVTSIGDALVPRLVAAVSSDGFLGDCRGLGTIDAALASGHGASGVVGRASGVALDVRGSDPDYAELRRLLPTPPALHETTGDVVSRARLMVAELGAAVALTRECAESIDPGEPVNVTLPKVLRVPVGTSVQWLETPLGAAGALLESQGDRAPHRYALRTPSFAHAPLLARALVGHRLADAPSIVSSFPMVVGDLDK